MADVLDRRRRERERLIAVARGYVERLSERLPVVAAAVVGSVARGGFNVWSDVDVVVVAPGLPQRVPDRLRLLGADAPPGIQPVGFTPAELQAARRRRNPLIEELAERGVTLVGEDLLRGS